MNIQEVYEEYKHLDALLSDSEFMTGTFPGICHDLWMAIKEDIQMNKRTMGCMNQNKIPEPPLHPHCRCTPAKLATDPKCNHEEWEIAHLWNGGVFAGGIAKGMGIQIRCKRCGLEKLLYTRDYMFVDDNDEVAD